MKKSMLVLIMLFFICGTATAAVPTAIIATPTEAQTLSNVYQSGSTIFTIVGTASDPDNDLDNFVLDFGSGSNPTSWTQIATGTSPVNNSTLGNCDTSGLTNGDYTIRLRVTDDLNQTTTALRHVTLGHFTVSQNVYEFNGAGGQTVTYTSIVPFTLYETIVIKNLGGSVVRTLLNAQQRTVGTYNDNFNGRNDSSSLLPDGPYFYVATATDGTNNMTWDLTNQYLGGTPLNILPPLYSYDPFNNQRLKFEYSFSQPGRVDLILQVDGGNQDCNPPNYCLLNAVYQESGPQTFYWSGSDGTSFRENLQHNTAYSRRNAFSKNAAVLFGTKPQITSLSVTPSYYRQPAGNQTISFNLISYQNQNVTLTVTYFSLKSLSVVKTITQNNLAPATPVTVTFNGLSDASLPITQGNYEITISVLDGIGNQVSQKILTAVAN